MQMDLLGTDIDRICMHEKRIGRGKWNEIGRRGARLGIGMAEDTTFHLSTVTDISVLTQVLLPVIHWISRIPILPLIYLLHQAPLHQTPVIPDESHDLILIVKVIMDRDLHP
jgi:hypothetical protein